MRKTALTFVVVGVAATLAVSGCSSKKKTPASTTSGASAGGTQVGVILPDTTTSTRYTLYDAPLLKKAFDAAGIKSDIQNAAGSTDKFVSISQTMISEGVKVLLIDPADPATGITVEKAAQAAGVKVIDYDRVNLGGTAPYYVSFDNVAVGKLQAQTLVSCLDAKGVKKARIIQMNGGTDIDNNAVLFKTGAHEVLDPLYAAGTLIKGTETDVSKWDNAVATTDFQQAFTHDGGKVDGVVAANDGIAASVISVLKSNHLTIPVTGQDATVQGLQYVIQGQQCMTVFKDVSKEADAAAKLAIALIKGDTAGAAALATGMLHDPTGNRDIPSVLLTPEAITVDKVKDVIAAGALTAAEICKGIESDCTKAKIS